MTDTQSDLGRDTIRLSPQEVRGVIGTDIGYSRHEHIGEREQKFALISQLPNEDEHARPANSRQIPKDVLSDVSVRDLEVKKSGRVLITL